MSDSNPSDVIVTIIYYKNDSLVLHHEVKSYPQNDNGRIIIPDDYKKDKSIIAVCYGEIDIINKVGDRIVSVGVVA